MADAKHPDTNWLNNYKARSVRNGWAVSLTRPQLEYLSAVAEDVMWDRSRFGSTSAQPASAIASESALLSKGLIERKPQHALKSPDAVLPSHNQLTRAGEHVVQLLKLADVYLKPSASSRSAKKRA